MKYIEKAQDYVLHYICERRMETHEYCIEY